MNRCVKPEILDELAPDDPRAVGSRRDLEKVNASMGNADIVARELARIFGAQPPGALAEIGAGDGRFALQVAQRLSPAWNGTALALVDRVEAVEARTLREFQSLNWRVEFHAADVFRWFERPESGRFTAVFANLFLHHFSDDALRVLLREVSSRTRVFIAVEPRRSAWCWCMSRTLWFLGCNSVTRHDAPVSVRAGFAGRELSNLWPAREGWDLRERPAGAFSHLFVARLKP
jgi:hypothetical protein